ncbi:MAG: NUDIX domain-containing protein [Halieaceae bacterium]|uniref:NUDIX hydrolase n=1 Tax=Haliea alexandrii TaxID=2448162 RepID=UPI000F0AFF62|nr:NUDIX domain-containing protein [Haliea alexandrii]MCR9186994.1 NUDIX domain-containing protein [Halieaceae bacterium]
MQPKEEPLAQRKAPESSDGDLKVVPARPASTVVLLRDGPEGLETLLLKRNKALLFAGGYWVFPGGALEASDWEQAGGDEERATRIAAAREAEEESGLKPAPDAMVLISHWTTPVVEPKRFSTWIYAAPVAAHAQVTIDGSEIHASRWLPVAQAVREHDAGELGVLPPTYITLCDIARYASVEELLRVERSRPPQAVFPRFCHGNGEVFVMFRGDAGYESGDGNRDGARHRAVLEDKRWRYVYEGVDAEFPCLIGPESP